MIWSVVLAAIGVFGLYLTTRKMAAGYAVGAAVQVLWITYAIVTAQYGFIFSALAFGGVNLWGYYQWKTETPPVPEPPRLERAEGGGTYLPTLAPHDFNYSGGPKWNHFPFVEVWGNRVVLGPQNKRVALSRGEAYDTARALVESAEFIYNKSFEEKP